MKPQFLHISLSFQGEVDVNALNKKFNLAIDWVKYMPNCWIVRTTSDTARWYKRLSPFLGEEDTMLIVKIDLRERTARLPDWVVEWVDEYIPENFLKPLDAPADHQA